LLQYLAKYPKSRYTYTSGCFYSYEINISQVGVATRLKCGGIFYNSSARNLLLRLLVKNFENWLAFSKFKGEIEWFYFSGHGVV